MAIAHTPVKSSNIESWGYGPEERVLEVRFKTAAGSGPLFRYLDVQDETIQGLIKAQSVGTFFAKAIKPRHKAQKVEPVTVRHNGEVIGRATMTLTVPEPIETA